MIASMRVAGNGKYGMTRRPRVRSYAMPPFTFSMALWHSSYFS